jgi:hypothetical protein
VWPTLGSTSLSQSARAGQDMPELVQIVPRLAPPPNGVGDHGLLLAKELRRTHGVVSRFIVGDPDWSGPSELEGFRVCTVRDRSHSALETLLTRELDQRQTVLLHYVGYGYEKRGCPTWLVRGLTQWRRRSAGRLVTMFHELYARGPIWSSSFWNSPLQLRLAARLARSSDRCRTSMRVYANRLERMAQRHRGRIAVLPVFSNMGAAEHPLPLAQRAAQLVIFGGGRWLDEAATRHRGVLDHACNVLGIDRIVAIGRPAGVPLRFSVPVEETGILAPGEVSRRLASARVGFLGHNSGSLGKSTIFAAYCAHRMLPLLASSDGSESDGVSPGRHYLVADKLNGSKVAQSSQQVADNAWAWYSEHSLERNAAAIVADCDLVTSALTTG